LERRWRALPYPILIPPYPVPARQVFRTRSAASLYAPLCGMNLLNGLLWTAYGSATGQPFVYGPNAFGAALALFQVALCCLFRSQPPRCAPPGLPAPCQHQAVICCPATGRSLCERTGCAGRLLSLRAVISAARRAATASLGAAWLDRWCSLSPQFENSNRA